jgi:hypothetical protein
MRFLRDLVVVSRFVIDHCRLRARGRTCPVSQAVMKQFGGGYGADGVFANEAEAQQHSKLEKLYISTRAAKVIKWRMIPSSLSLLGT